MLIAVAVFVGLVVALLIGFSSGTTTKSSTSTNHFKDTTPGSVTATVFTTLWFRGLDTTPTAAPALGKDLVVVPLRTELVAFDAAGQPAWTAPLDDTTSGIVIAGDQVVVVVGTQLRGLDAASGDAVWDKDLGERPAGTLVTDGTRVFVATDAVRAFDARTGAVAWTSATRTAYPPAVDPGGRRVAFSDGSTITVVDGATGSLIITFRHGTSSTQPVYSADHFYFDTSGATIVAVDGSVLTEVSSAKSGAAVALAADDVGGVEAITTTAVYGGLSTRADYTPWIVDPPIGPLRTVATPELRVLIPRNNALVAVNPLSGYIAGTATVRAGGQSADIVQLASPMVGTSLAIVTTTASGKATLQIVAVTNNTTGLRSSTISAGS